MIFLGRILQVDDRDEYYKTVIGVETGYTTEFTSFEFFTIRLNVDQLSMIRWFSLVLKDGQ